MRPARPPDYGPAPQLPPPARPWFPVLRPRPSHSIRGWCSNVRPYVVHTHWCETARREKRCTLDLGRCFFCEQAQARRWAGWIALWVDPPGRLGLAEITEGAARNTNSPHFRDEACSMRGMHVELMRLTRNSKGPVRLNLTSGLACPLNLPEAPDMVSLVSRLYRVTVGGDDSCSPVVSG